VQPVLVLKVGDTYPEIASEHGDFEDWVSAGLGTLVDGIRVVDARSSALPNFRDYAGVVVTGSHAMVSDMPAWSKAAGKWLRDAVEGDAAVLGICYGHQLLASAFGGEIGYHPEGLEVGTVPVRTTYMTRRDPLFQHVSASFQAHTVHSQSVLKLPPQAVILACNEFEAHHAFRIGDSAWGVQFHPEFSEQVMRGYICRTVDRQRRVPAVAPTKAAASILHKFSEFVQMKS
jgi:GMP synthase (glutamine-hydrolysing)